MSGLEYLIGEPISHFLEDRLPTIQDVLCFYAQYWGVRKSDSSKENYVAEALVNFYKRKNILTFNVQSIKNKIKKTVCELRKIIKFKSKIKTVQNIRTEALFRSRLNDIFEIRRQIQTISNPIEHDGLNEMDLDVDMEDIAGIFAIKIHLFIQFDEICI